MSKHSGTCLCGAVRFEMEADFHSFMVCHCSRCRRSSGSAFATNLFARGGSLEWVCGEEHVRHFRLPGSRFSRSFCSECGSQLPQSRGDGEHIFAPAGCLEPEFEPPAAKHIFCGSAASWEPALDQGERWDALPQ